MHRTGPNGKHDNTILYLDRCVQLLKRIQRVSGGDVLDAWLIERDALLKEIEADDPPEESDLAPINDPIVAVFQIYKNNLGATTWEIDTAHGKRVSKQAPRTILHKQDIRESMAGSNFKGLGTKLFNQWIKEQPNAPR